MSYPSLYSGHYWSLVRVFGRVHETHKGRENEKNVPFLSHALHQKLHMPLIMLVVQASYSCTRCGLEVLSVKS